MKLKRETLSNGDSRTVSSSSQYFSVKRIALLAVMTALTTVGRLVFALPIMPNIQPMTALLIIIALNIGVMDSLVVSVLSMLLTNLILGMGPWTVFQMLSFTVVILLTGLLKFLYRSDSIVSRIFFSGWALLAGFIYGLIISFMTYRLYGMGNFLVYYINGLPFDLMHGVGNAAFFFILEPILVPIIDKKFSAVLN